MIYELRCYRFKPGLMPEYLNLVENVGTAIRGDDYGIREGSWVAEFGTLNQVWHLWRYDDLNHRQAMRAALAENAAWMNDFVANIKDLLVDQQIRLMRAVVPLKPPGGVGHIYELRLYQTLVARAPSFAKAFKEALPARERYSKNVGIWLPESPSPNEIVHLWAFEDVAARAEARAAAQKDPQWAAFLKSAIPDVIHMQSALLLPTKFSPMQ